MKEITEKSFSDTFINKVCDLKRISEEQFKELLYGKDNSENLNLKAERYIKTYLRNDVDMLTDDNWITAKELYIHWKVFEGEEKEEVSQDKKDSLIEVLELFKDMVINRIEKEENYTGKRIRVYKGNYD